MSSYLHLPCTPCSTEGIFPDPVGCSDIRKYLFDPRYTTVVDHRALQFLIKPHKFDAKTTVVTSERLSIVLTACNYNIVNRPGKEIPQADLSCWPEMDADIVKTTKNCEASLQKFHFRPNSWSPWTEGCHPQQHIHADFCDPFLNRYHASVMIDSYSTCLDVFLSSTWATSFAIQMLRKCSSHEGIPQVLIIDSGSQFCVTKLKCCFDRIRCRNHRIAPRHPCSNGAEENLVKLVKNALLFANCKTLQNLETFTENVLIEYLSTTHGSMTQRYTLLF